VVKLVDAEDSKSSGLYVRVGSIPTSGTNKIKGLFILINSFFCADFMDCARNHAHLPPADTLPAALRLILNFCHLGYDTVQKQIWFYDLK
jgi:hypothetical protein